MIFAKFCPSKKRNAVGYIVAVITIYSLIYIFGCMIGAVANILICIKLKRGLFLDMKNVKGNSLSSKLPRILVPAAVIDCAISLSTIVILIVNTLGDEDDLTTLMTTFLLMQGLQNVVNPLFHTWFQIISKYMKC